ncbi:tripartite tricarboxylate transporter permease [Citricoccus sp. NR2]|uniref:tripartite tricarboxylate transporter permease n=1 Tax=Citricoccus sp. NR2 TaxID=3004095 RepID=UPI0022DD2059|nr:tripartite tricarboxylate transporter permease [Citricoccus sp. NR2]WBL19493.1 tripartite tricarboxylate transporter permease [Citricoccus sp. NR2]
MEIIEGLMQGFSVALSPINLLYVALGVTMGTVFGLLPGIGPTAAVALLLPMTFTMEPASGIIMLAGIYYGSMYGGRIPAILMRLPGDSSSVLTTLDGYPLTQQGRAGAALGITAIGSFLGGTVAIIGLSILAPTLAQFASSFAPPELFLLMLFGLFMIVLIGSGKTVKSILMALLGIVIATVGMDPISGTSRLTFGSYDLAAGIGIVPLAIGLFGIGEVLNNMAVGSDGRSKIGKMKGFMPSWADWVTSRMAILRASVLGFFIGILPGGGGTVSSVMAYGLEKKFSKSPEKFGKGAIDGLAATETADNASSNSAFVPLLTLGVPPNPVLALMFGALLLQNITPGPQLVNEHPDVFYGVIASMYIGNIILLMLNLPLIRVFVSILRVPQSLLGPLVILIAICGVYAVSNSMFDVLLMLIAGIGGFILRRFEFDLAPLILGFILGPMLEVEWRRAMIMSEGSFGIFLDRPASLVILMLLLATVSLTSISAMRKRRSLVSRVAAESMDTLVEHK